ncbi:MAG: DNA mismatch repair protein MutS [Bacteroidetes bacterium HGW-Bacteroidetes-21]|nr:MAG: DNA mismatch repair protein MutS [Bacteroidetes bacterium HGW-Bacteroidetes-21]
MQQYNTIKTKFPDAILLFRVGDFYETFGSDAIKTAGILGITLTKRHNGSASELELAGPKLVRAGERVAICDQLEDPKMTKKIVKRGVTELVTPGVTTNDNVLNVKENNYLCCIYLLGKIAAATFLDISTGEFYVSEGSLEQTEKLIQNLSPKEILYERSQHEKVTALLGNRFYLYKLDEWMFSPENAKDKILKHFGTASLRGFGIDTMQAGIIAAGAVFYYLEQTHHDKLKHIVSASRIDHDNYVWLDKFTIRNLELFGTFSEGGSSLCGVVDNTHTPMGSRMLKRWIAMPLKDISAINHRLNIVEFFFSQPEKTKEITDLLKEVGDLERLAAKIATLRVNPREVVQLRRSLQAIGKIKAFCSQNNNESLNEIAEQLNECVLICERILREINPEPPVQIGKGDVIAQGFSPELDEIRAISRGGKDFLVSIQQREIENTGITSLKINYNNVFGYYIEVRNTHKDKVPTDWIRKQTLVSAERYITPELKEYEEKILSAEDKILSLESTLFANLVSGLSEYIPTFQNNSLHIARLDSLVSFAIISLKNNYVRPQINDGYAIDIRDGRHPVIETQLPGDEKYVPNDIYLDNEQQQIIIVTGPNMAGKSALLRQTALICLMAQMGCFVPASSAHIGYVDKIFTRVGASDNISQGESTFMVEMIETASILNNLSSRSLVLLDEIGRGTSTYDGISIAWSITEFLHENPHNKAKTLFATHYHELNEMAGTFPRIKNFHVTVKESGNRVIFLRKLQAGGTEHSFGIHVAEMAGMPKTILKRANEILSQLEKPNDKKNPVRPVKEMKTQKEGYQLTMFQLDDPVLKQIRDEIKNSDINNLTPLEALNKLNEIKRLSGL